MASAGQGKAKTGKEQVIDRLRTELGSETKKKEAENILNLVINAIEKTLIDNLDRDRFSLKLNSFAKLTVHHRAGIKRRIPFTGVVVQTKDKRKVKFATLGNLRKQEVKLKESQ